MGGSEVARPTRGGLGRCTTSTAWKVSLAPHDATGERPTLAAWHLKPIAEGRTERTNRSAPAHQQRKRRDRRLGISSAADVTEGLFQDDAELPVVDVTGVITLGCLMALAA